MYTVPGIYYDPIYEKFALIHNIQGKHYIKYTFLAISQTSYFRSFSIPHSVTKGAKLYQPTDITDLDKLRLTYPEYFI